MNETAAIGNLPISIFEVSVYRLGNYLHSSSTIGASGSGADFGLRQKFHVYLLFVMCFVSFSTAGLIQKVDAIAGVAGVASVASVAGSPPRLGQFPHFSSCYQSFFKP